ASSVPTCIQCSAATIAQRGIAYGMDCVQCDGNDIFAVVKVMKDAITRARESQRPSFIEALTYRLGDHTTADDARRYRDAAELDRALTRDPLVRTRKYLESKGLWDDGRQSKLDERAAVIVHEVVEAALNIEKPPPEDLFHY